MTYFFGILNFLGSWSSVPLPPNTSAALNTVIPLSSYAQNYIRMPVYNSMTCNVAELRGLGSVIFHQEVARTPLFSPIGERFVYF